MKFLLSHAALVLGISLGAGLGGCVHITHTYTGMPGGGGSQSQQAAQTVAGRDCGCAGTSAPVYTQNGSDRPYPVYYYPPSYPRSNPSGYPPYGGYYPRPNRTGSPYDHDGDDAPADGTAPRPVDSRPRRTDSSQGRDVTPDTRIGGAGTTVGINPGYVPPTSTPRGPRVEDTHEGDVRTSGPIGGRTHEGTPVSNVPEGSTRAGSVPSVRRDAPDATVPHDDVTMRPPANNGTRESAPRGGSRPAGGTEADTRSRPDTNPVPVATPARTSDANASGAVQSESTRPRTVPSRPEPVPVNAGANGQAGTADKAKEPVVPAAGTGSGIRREAPVTEKTESQIARPAAGSGSQVRPVERGGEGATTANTTPVAGTQEQMATEKKVEGKASSVESAVAHPAEVRINSGGSDSLKPAVGVSVGAAGDGDRISVPR